LITQNGDEYVFSDGEHGNDCTLPHKSNDHNIELVYSVTRTRANTTQEPRSITKDETLQYTPSLFRDHGGGIKALLDKELAVSNDNNDEGTTRSNYVQ